MATTLKKQRSDTKKQSLEESQVVAAELKKDGDRQFATKEFQKALDSYSSALKLLPQNHPDQVALYSNKAACFLFTQKYKDAVRECSNALLIDPKFSKALQRRATAYEHMQHYKQAMSDIQALIKGGYDTDEVRKDEQSGLRFLQSISRQLEAIAFFGISCERPGMLFQGSAKISNMLQPVLLTAMHQIKKTNNGMMVILYNKKESQNQLIRLKDYMAGRRPISSNGKVQQTTAQSKQATLKPQFNFFNAKITYNDGEEIKVIELPLGSSYADMVYEIRNKFPEVGPFILKYQNDDNELITVTSREDISNACQQAIANVTQQSAGRRVGRIPKAKFFIEEVEDEKEVPTIPMGEVKEREKANLNKQTEQQVQTKDEPADQDDWVVDFAYLFREQLKLDVDRRMDLQQVGWEKCQSALDDKVSGEKSTELFQQAIEKFRELTAVGLFNWGVAHNYQVQRKMEDYINLGGQKMVLDKQDELLEQLSVCDEKFDQSLYYKKDHFDTFLAQSQLLATKAKIQIGFYLPLNTKEDEKKLAESTETGDTKDSSAQENKELTDEEKQAKDDKTRAIQKEKIIELVKNIKQGNLSTAEKLFAQSHERFQQTMKLAQQQKEELQELIQQQLKELPTDDPEDALKVEQLNQQMDESDAPITNVLMSWGNILFEESLVYAGIGQDWKPSLFEAIDKFREGGAKENDILAAMKIHMKQDEIQLPPIPEHIKIKQEQLEKKQNDLLRSQQQQQEAERKLEEQAEKQKGEDSVKGLPSLKQRGKKDKSTE